MRNIKEWGIVILLKAFPARNHILNLFERSALSEETPSQVKYLTLNEPSQGRGVEPGLSWEAGISYIRAEASARRKYFPPLNLDGDCSMGCRGQKKKKRNKSLFSWFVDLQEEHFLFISLSRHRTSPTGLALSLTIFLPLSLLLRMGKKVESWYQQLCKDSMEAVPRVLDLRLRWIQQDVFKDFRPWAEGTVKRSESWKFRKMCGSTWTLGQMLHFTTDMTYLRVL